LHDPLHPEARTTARLLHVPSVWRDENVEGELVIGHDERPQVDDLSARRAHFRARRAHANQPRG
jgi:hypothetical protein